MKTAKEVLEQVYLQEVSDHFVIPPEENYLIKAMEEYADQFKQKWIMADIPPKTRASYSELDYFVETKYRFTIGRTFKGNWVDMENRPIEDVVRYTNLPYPYNE